MRSLSFPAWARSTGSRTARPTSRSLHCPASERHPKSFLAKLRTAASGVRVAGAELEGGAGHGAHAAKAEELSHHHDRQHLEDLGKDADILGSLSGLNEDGARLRLSSDSLRMP